MKSRFFCALLCLCLTLTLLPAVALADAFPAAGLDLSGNPAAATYTAGGGTVVWDPNANPATLTFNNATIAVSSDISVVKATAVTLPGRPVTVTFNGTNSIAANNPNSACVFNGGSDMVFSLAAGSDTTLSTGRSQEAYTISGSGAVEIKGEGKLSISAQSMYAFPIFADGHSIRFTGGTLAFRISGSMVPENCGTLAASATLGGVTIPGGETLDLHLVSGSVVKGASGAVNNGTLVLRDGTTPAQIAALGLTGSGVVRVGSDTYSNGGQRMHTSLMNFAQPAASGGWNENADLDADGYTFTGSAAGGYTLTLGNLLMSVNNIDPAMILPPDGPVRVVLADGTTARITNKGAGADIAFPKTGVSYPCTITGGGTLVLTADRNGRTCIDAQQPLTIADGNITMTNKSGYACIDAHDTALTVSGGRLDMNAQNAAVLAGSVTLLNGITPVSPAGAQFLEGRFRLNGSPVARLILGVPVDVPKTGDDTPVLLLCGLLLASGAGLAILATVRMRKRER